MMHCCYSKATTLIFIWSLSVSTTVWFYSELAQEHFYSKLATSRVLDYIFKHLLSTLIIAISIPLSGWLADQKFGNYKVFKVGSVLMFLGSLLLCLGILVLMNIDSNGRGSFITNIIVASLTNLVFLSGGSACLVTVFQLGLDQMPDASSTDIINYILWFFISVAVGFWSSNSLYRITEDCSSQQLFVQIWSLCPIFCTSILLCSLFIFGEKWLIIEPESPQSLKNIYRVLKFAAKHKSPLNRSAFTYWEEDIPSRLDLGKSRYGGPFTIEQVEDVKTFFRLLTTLVPVWANVFSNNVNGTLYVLYHPLNISDLPQHTYCMYTVFSKFTYNPFWCSMVTALFYKFVIFQFFKHRLGSSLKRIGVLMLMEFFLNIVFFIFSVISLMLLKQPTSQWSFVIYLILSYTLFALFCVFTVEFVCAQAPYSMRGLLSGLVFFTIVLFAVLGEVLGMYLTFDCGTKTCKIIQCSIAAGLSAVGFLLSIVVARRYKLRVRDEGYDLYEVVRNTYYKYLALNRSPRSASPSSQ